MTVHLHYPGRPSDIERGDTRCRVWCGPDCDAVPTAYAGRDPERVTCPDCLTASGRAS